MAYISSFDDSETSTLVKEDFTAVVEEETGRVTLIIPRIAVVLSSETWADFLVKDIFDGIEFYERQPR